VRRFRRVLRAAQPADTVEAPPGLRPIALPATRPPLDVAAEAELLRLAPMRAAALSEAVLQAGVYRDRYCVAPRAGGGLRLLLAIEGEERFCTLADVADEAAAVRAAACLQALLLRMNVDCEGLHVVEHLLLAPAADALAPPPEALAFRLSVVFPDWTARCRRPGFQAFAEETVALNCPAHLLPQCLWLGFEAMQHFEAAHQRWLDARFAQAQGEGSVQALDDAAAALRALLHAGGRDA